MQSKTIYSRKAAGVCLEVSGTLDRFWGHVVYPFPDERFEAGGLGKVMAVMALLVEQLAGMGELPACLVCDMTIAAAEDDPAGDDKIEQLRARFEREVETRPRGRLGAFEQVTGTFIKTGDAVALMRRLSRHFDAASAELSLCRVLLLDGTRPDADGFDIAHDGGITVVGRWDGNLAEGKPGALSPADLEPLMRVFDEIARAPLPMVMGESVA